MAKCFEHWPSVIDKTTKSRSKLEIETISQAYLLWEKGKIEERTIFQDLLLPNGIIYNRKNDEVRPSIINLILL